MHRPLAFLLIPIAAALVCAGCGARSGRRSGAPFEPPEHVERPVRPAGADEMRAAFRSDMRQIELLLSVAEPPFERLVEPAHRLYRTASKLVWLASVGCKTPDDRFLRDARMIQTNAAGLWDSAMTRRVEGARESWRKFKISFGYCYPATESASTP